MPTAKPRVYAILEPAEMQTLKAIAIEQDRTVSWLVKFAVVSLIEARHKPVQLNLFVDFPENSGKSARKG
jgi:hypothetical protein